MPKWSNVVDPEYDTTIGIAPDKNASINLGPIQEMSFTTGINVKVACANCSSLTAAVSGYNQSQKQQLGRSVYFSKLMKFQKINGVYFTSIF